MKNRNRIFTWTLVYLAWLLISSTSTTTIDNSSEKESNKTEWINDQPEEGDNSATALENQASGNLDENEFPQPAASTELYSEDFENGGLMPSGWTTQTDGPNNNPWEILRDFLFGNYLVECRSDLGPGTSITERLLMTDYIDCSDYTSLELEFYLNYDYDNGDEYALVIYKLSYTPSWTIAQMWNMEDVHSTQIIDLSSAAGDPEVRIGFVYHGTNDRWMRVDDIILRGEEQDDGDDDDDDNGNSHKKSDEGIGGGMANFLLSPIGLIAVGGITVALIAIAIVVWVVKKKHRK